MPADITAETIQKILDISKPEMHELEDVHGVKATYCTKVLHQVEAEAPKMLQAVAVNTLAGFADLVKAKLEDQAFSTDFLIHIEDENTVTLKARESDDYGRRQVLIQAKPVSFDKFRFGQWLSQEEFVISVASRFAETEDRDYILKAASTLTNEAVMTHEDNGFVQKATARAGMRVAESVTLKPRAALAPFRTFPELEQPVSEFVFRAKCEEGGKPQLMLVEADGGRWKIAAINTIKAAMEAFDLNIPIIA